MLTIKNWRNKPTEITVDNFYKQSLSIFDDDNLIIHVNAGDCAMVTIELLFENKIEEALTIIFNNQRLRGLEAEDWLKKLNLEIWDR